VYASPTAAQGRVYIAGRNGRTLVLKHGPKYEVLATNASTIISMHRLRSQGMSCICAVTGRCTVLLGSEARRKDLEASQILLPNLQAHWVHCPAPSASRRDRPDRASPRVAFDVSARGLSGQPIC